MNPATFTFGSGETRESENQQQFGGVVVGAPPRS